MALQLPLNSMGNRTARLLPTCLFTTENYKLITFTQQLIYGLKVQDNESNTERF
ncbi:argininosuccinate lyase [Oceanobacillus picturae]|uniref:Argininosuccinate lyase n=1 Tax=Oceanobacillus picturae TaxID=171693 RepID=A0A0U9HEX1_9BACI|nr:argininosuccinate lyase [Oceanobacillus picturae]